MKSAIWIYWFVTSGWSQQTDQHNVYKANLMLQLPARKSKVFFLSMCNWPAYSGSFCFFFIMYFLQKYSRQVTAKEAIPDGERNTFSYIPVWYVLVICSGSIAQLQWQGIFRLGQIIWRWGEGLSSTCFPGEGRRCGCQWWKLLLFACTWELSLHNGLSTDCWNKFLITAE